MARHVDDKVAVILQSGEVVLVRGDDGASNSCITFSCTEVGDRVNTIKVEPMQFGDPFFLLLHGEALLSSLVDEVVVALEHSLKLYRLKDTR